MISYSEIASVFSFNLEGKYCIEIEFSVKGHSRYQSCWMGKMPNKANKEKNIFWYGLVSDGTEGYDYDNFQDFSDAPVFGGKTLKQIWNSVIIFSIDGCNPEDRIQFYV